MKTKIFTVWTNLIDKFLNDIAAEAGSYNDLSAWLDSEGPKVFQMAQGEYFGKNKSKFIEETDGYPPRVRIDLSYEQIGYGFDKLFEKLTKDFSQLNSESIKEKYATFRKDCLSEDFLPFIAARAVITARMVKTNEPDQQKNLESTMKAFEFLGLASQLSIDSMNEYRQKQSNIPRGPSSPLLHKAKLEPVVVDSRSEPERKMQLK